MKEEQLELDLTLPKTKLELSDEMVGLCFHSDPYIWIDDHCVINLDGHFSFEELQEIVNLWNKEKGLSIGKTLEELIERVENYPCSMSCYSTIAEMKSAQSMKQSILQILKGEL